MGSRLLADRVCALEAAKPLAPDLLPLAVGHSGAPVSSVARGAVDGQPPAVEAVMRATWPEVIVAGLCLVAYGAGALSALFVAGLLKLWRRER